VLSGDVDVSRLAYSHRTLTYLAGLHWGLLLDAPARGRLGDRNPMHRPFFRSVLVPRQRARCLVNLTGVQHGQRFLDPFCGTGSLLVEAALVGALACGSDIDSVMVNGSQANLRHEGLPGQVRRIDARRLDEWGTVFDALATAFLTAGQRQRTPRCLACCRLPGRSARRARSCRLS
jgi:SAM-dependent methyltransferase